MDAFCHFYTKNDLLVCVASTGLAILLYNQEGSAFAIATTSETKTLLNNSPKRTRWQQYVGKQSDRPYVLQV